MLTTTVLMTNNAAAVATTPSMLRQSHAGNARLRRAAFARTANNSSRRASAPSTVCAFRIRGDTIPTIPSSTTPKEKDKKEKKVVNRAAPPSFESELGRLEAAGVDVHNTGVEYLMEGATGDFVKELQRFLTATGHYRYKDGITGFYGPVTTNAVKKWQHKHGLPASGGWGYQSRDMYLRVKAVERRKLLASPEAPTKPGLGFEEGTSGLALPSDGDGVEATSTAVGYWAAPSAAPVVRSRGLSAVSVITNAFWFVIGTALVVGVGRSVQWLKASRDAARAEQQEMEQDRKEVYDRWDTAVKESDVKVEAGIGDDAAVLVKNDDEGGGGRGRGRGGVAAAEMEVKSTNKSADKSAEEEREESSGEKEKEGGKEKTASSSSSSFSLAGGVGDDDGGVKGSNAIEKINNKKYMAAATSEAAAMLDARHPVVKKTSEEKKKKK